MTFLESPYSSIRQGSRRKFFSTLVLIAVCATTMGVSKKASGANIPVVVTQCSTCVDQPGLMGAAVQYFQTYTGAIPPGYAGGVVGPPSGLYCNTGDDYTVLLVVSSAVPLSGSFYNLLDSPALNSANGKVSSWVTRWYYSLSADI
jgi:hypothetical protein